MFLPCGIYEIPILWIIKNILNTWILVYGTFFSYETNSQCVVWPQFVPAPMEPLYHFCTENFSMSPLNLKKRILSQYFENGHQNSCRLYILLIWNWISIRSLATIRPRPFGTTVPILYQNFHNVVFKSKKKKS